MTLTTTNESNDASAVAMESNDTVRQPRVPKALQAVLLAANRGEQVQVPADHVAYKTFRFFRGRRTATPLTTTTTTNSTNSSTSKSPTLRSSISSRGNIKSISITTTRPSTTVRHHSTRNHISPQTYLTSLLKNRGYSAEEFSALQTGYYNRPTKFQTASYGRYLVDCVRDNDLFGIREALQMGGLSPVACNDHGESIIHLACRLGHSDMLSLLLALGASVQLVDDCGRTPLHSACWSKTVDLEVIDILLKEDSSLLLLKDSRGTLPLQYLKNENWTAWTKYLMSRKDEFWPDRDIKRVGLKAPSALTQAPAHSHPVCNPRRTPPNLELINLVAQGRMTPLEASTMRKLGSGNANGGSLGDSTTDEEDYSESDDDSDDDDDDDETCWDDEDDDADSVATFDEDDMAQLLGTIGTPAGGVGRRSVNWS